MAVAQLRAAFDAEASGHTNARRLEAIRARADAAVFGAIGRFGVSGRRATALHTPCARVRRTRVEIDPITRAAVLLTIALRRSAIERAAVGHAYGLWSAAGRLRLRLRLRSRAAPARHFQGRASARARSAGVGSRGRLGLGAYGMSAASRAAKQHQQGSEEQCHVSLELSSAMQEQFRPHLLV